MPADDHDDDLALALRLADTADAITLAHFGSAGLRVERKADSSPVSDADRACEVALRTLLAHERPGDAILGEEQGGVVEPSVGGRRWILDPIDGTRAFVRGLAVFATLIALEEAGDVVVGVVSAPALGRRWWAARGGGAVADGRAIRVSPVARVEDAFLSTTDPRSLPEPGQRHAYSALAARTWTARALGDFWSHVLVAEGTIDIAVEPVAAVWDLAPLRVIVEEAGGRFTDLGGSSRIDGGNAVSSNGLLHDAVLEALRV